MATGLHQIHSVGFDQITVNGLAAEAGVARGTVYAYFGDVSGLFATLWSEVGFDWLQTMVDPSSTAPSTPDDRAMLLLLTLARRNPTLLEVVQPDLNRTFTELRDRGDIALLRAIWMLTMRLGIETANAKLSEVEIGYLFLELLAAMPDDAAEQVGIDPGDPLTVERITPSLPLVETLDEVSQRLVRATMQVVATSGVAAASMMRICRVARLSTGAATPRFPSLQLLHDFTFQQVMGDIVRGNTRQLPSTQSTPDDDNSFRADLNAAMFLASLSPERHLWRAYRQEVSLAACYDEHIASLLTGVYQDANAELLQAFIGMGVRDDLSQLTVVFNVLGAGGSSALALLDAPLLQLDHRVPMRWLLAQVSGTLG